VQTISLGFGAESQRTVVAAVIVSQLGARKWKERREGWKMGSSGMARKGKGTFRLTVFAEEGRVDY